MNYIQYIKGDDANGEGMRCTLFVSGCEMACLGCHNKESWKLNAGQLYTKEFEDKIIEDLKSPYISGLSLSGGNPTHTSNFKTVYSLCERVKKETGKSIWLWTGMTLEELTECPKRRGIIKCLDVIIDGRFELDKKDLNLKWKGSSNQRVIKIKELHNVKNKRRNFKEQG